MTDSQLGLSPNLDLTPLRRSWGWIVALGAVYLIVGLIALGSVLMATAASVFFVGFMMIIAGVGEFINAFRAQGWGRSILWMLLGLLYITAGIVTFKNPLLAAATLTLFLGIAITVSGVIRIALALSVTSEKGWVWLLVSALVTLALGIVILSGWPTSSVYTLGIFLGVDLVMAGFGWWFMGFSLKPSKASAA